MKTQIPTYRAKTIDSDKYVEFDCFFKQEETLHEKETYKAITKIVKDCVDGWDGIIDIPYTQKIDPSTLAIHFPDMLDSEGTKIFASLSRYGTGGDIAESEYSNFLVMLRGNSFVLVHEPTCREEAEGECKTDILNKECIKAYKLKVVGIQQ